MCYAIGSCAALAAVHYDVTLVVDPTAQVLRGTEELTTSDARVFHKGSGLELSNAAQTLLVPAHSRARFNYTARAGQGFRWLPDQSGFFTAFHCGAWMICDPDPGERATLRLEVIVPVSTSWTVAGPGVLRSRRRVGGNDHFVFEEKVPAQTYLFSFGAASLRKFDEGGFTVYSRDGDQAEVFAKTRDAWNFLRSKAGVDPPKRNYAQAFLPGTNLGQEASGLALMGESYREKMAGADDDVALMAHEAAHQWWGVLIGIRSWSDFWLNEGMAEFFTAAYLEHRHGREAYDRHIEALREQYGKLQSEGKNRPLHWTEWKTATEALGRIPYVKGAIFLDALRRELGEEVFWKGIAAYTTRHAGKLVDSTDFQKAIEEAAGRSLDSLFDRYVYR